MYGLLVSEMLWEYLDFSKKILLGCLWEQRLLSSLHQLLDEEIQREKTKILEEHDESRKKILHPPKEMRHSLQ